MFDMIVTCDFHSKTTLLVFDKKNVLKYTIEHFFRVYFRFICLIVQKASQISQEKQYSAT